MAEREQTKHIVRSSSIAHLFTQLFFVHTYIKAVYFKKGDWRHWRGAFGLDASSLFWRPPGWHLWTALTIPTKKKKATFRSCWSSFFFSYGKKESIKTKGSEKSTIKERWLFVFTFASFTLWLMTLLKMFQAGLC